MESQGAFDESLMLVHDQLEGLVGGFLAFEEALMGGRRLLLQSLHGPQPFLDNLKGRAQLTRLGSGRRCRYKLLVG